MTKGQEAQCVYTVDHGKHMNIPSEHRKDYKFWVRQCPLCGWIDTEDIESQALSQYKQQLVEQLEEEKQDPPAMGWYCKGIDKAISIIKGE